jgi:hypothetical protein
VYVSDSDGPNHYGTIQDALNAVNGKYVADASWPDKVTNNPNPGEAVSAEIVLQKSVSEVITIANPSGTTIYPPLILRADKPVQPDENGVYSAGDITLSGDASLLTVGDGVTLTLRDITLKGMGGGNDYTLVKVNKGGNLILADNAVIYGHYNAKGHGGGVYVGSGGTFTMSGGEIRDNSTLFYNGGGVYVGGGGTFTMSGGEIRENHASFGGGVCVQATTTTTSGGTFTMSDGEIWGNSADKNGGGVYVKGNGHFAKTGESVIYGKNETGAVDGYSNKVGGAYSGNAVYVDSSPTKKKRDSTAGKNDNLFYNAVDEDIEDFGWDPQP